MTAGESLIFGLLLLVHSETRGIKDRGAILLDVLGLLSMAAGAIRLVIDVVDIIQQGAA